MQILADLFAKIFGSGKELTWLQMSLRGILIFFIALALIRVSGRRSFGLHMPLDNIITITLGAVLSRAIVGASDFGSVIIACTVIVLLHRVLGWLLVHYPRLTRWMEGEKIILFDQNEFIQKNMDQALVCREDVMQGVRKSALTQDLTKIDKIYIERNGEISALKKK
jgi:uncharacterized membrane protein YcaP (DUF421 family)